MKAQTKQNAIAENSAQLGQFHWKVTRLVNTVGYGFNLMKVVGKAMIREFVRSYKKIDKLSGKLDSSSRRIIEEIGTRHKIMANATTKAVSVFDESVAASAEPARNPYTNVFVWRNLTPGNFPSPEKLSERIICLEYSEKDEEALLEWISACNAETSNQIIPFKVMIVFADFANLKGKDVARLIGKFNKAGASFNDFPEGTTTFERAVWAYDNELEEIRLLNDEEYEDEETSGYIQSNSGEFNTYRV
jgi:hypothetical protein